MPDPKLELFVCLDVDDLERAIAFYVEALGLTVHRRYSSTFAELRGATSPLHLLQKAPGTRASPATLASRDYARHWTPVHLDFVVQNLETALRRVISAGGKLEGSSAHDWGRMANLADPFGHGFCLLELSAEGYGG